MSAVEEAQRSLSCVAFSGGGQPYPAEGVNVLDPDLLRQRASALYSIDSKKRLRKSYENPAIEEVFSLFSVVPAPTRPTNCCTPITKRDCREGCDRHE